MSDIWDNDKAKKQKRHADRLRGNNYGKGDKRRPTNETAYALGMKLIRVKEQHGADSSEYKKTLKAWRDAVRKGS